MLAEIRAAGGEVYGLTSEPHSLAAEAETAWDMSIPVVGDPHHEIREDLKARGWLDIFYNEDFGHLRNRSWANHPKGYYQPAVIALRRSDASAGHVLYRWRCVPRYSNMSGAGGRPEARYTWNQISTRLGLPAEDERARQDAALDEAPEMGAPDLSWRQFLMIMLAHGWFIRPRAFPLRRDGGKDDVSPTDAMRRWYVFGLVWLVALVALPLGWVAGVFIVWLIALVPGLVEIHRQFQNAVPET